MLSIKSSWILAATLLLSPVSAFIYDVYPGKGLPLGGGSLVAGLNTPQACFESCAALPLCTTADAGTGPFYTGCLIENGVPVLNNWPGEITYVRR